MHRVPDEDLGRGRIALLNWEDPMIAAAALLWQLSTVTGQSDPKALLEQVKGRLRPEIESLTQASGGLGPQFTDLETHEPLLSNFTVSQFIQQERFRLIEIFSAKALRPLQIAVVAKFDADLRTSRAYPFLGFCRGDCVSKSAVSALISQIASYLTKIEQLPSLVTNITATSIPSGARVYFLVGTEAAAEREFDTQGIAYNLYLGDYEVRMTKDGFQPGKLPMKLLDEPLTAVSCTLRRTGESASTTCERH